MVSIHIPKPPNFPQPYEFRLVVFLNLNVAFFKGVKLTFFLLLHFGTCSKNFKAWPVILSELTDPS